jgi:hypothetical protein
MAESHDYHVDIPHSPPHSCLTCLLLVQWEISLAVLRSDSDLVALSYVLLPPTRQSPCRPLFRPRHHLLLSKIYSGIMPLPPFLSLPDPLACTATSLILTQQMASQQPHLYFTQCSPSDHPPPRTFTTITSLAFNERRRRNLEQLIMLRSGRR